MQDINLGGRAAAFFEHCLKGFAGSLRQRAADRIGCHGNGVFTQGLARV